MINRLNRPIGTNLVVTLSLIGCLAVVSMSGGQGRTKKQIMVEMAEQFSALNEKMVTGALRVKFSDADFTQIRSSCQTIRDLAKEYAELESDQDVSTISTSMATSVEYLDQQAARKDPLVLVMTYGRILSYCAECHYQTRWAAKPIEKSPKGGL